MFDKFHIIANFNKLINQVRQNEQSRSYLSEYGDNNLKHRRWTLLKDRDNLRKKDRA
ncbi:MAG TPA: transposase [Halanaerobiales bacterium]|nr:transposase [Halanaerobiales bacterium]